jgi:hypothetical protein
MTIPQQSHSPHLHSALAEKLDPNRFPRMSGLMAAVVGFVLGVRFSSPSIAEIVVTSDGFVLARLHGEVGANQLIGRHADLARNWFGLMTAAGLTTQEWIEAAALFAAKIGYFGRAIA